MNNSADDQAFRLAQYAFGIDKNGLAQGTIVV